MHTLLQSLPHKPHKEVVFTNIVIFDDICIFIHADFVIKKNNYSLSTVFIPLVVGL